MVCKGSAGKKEGRMQVVILAGGRGERLKPVTDTIPKPMISVNGKPFLHYQLERLRSSAFLDIVLLVGYRAEQVRDYCGDGSRTGQRIRYSYEKTPLGTGGAIKNAEKILDNEFMILNGDTYLEIDYDLLVDYFHGAGTLGVIVAYADGRGQIPCNMKLDSTNCVIHYDKRATSGMTHVDAGVAIFKKEILNIVPAGRFCSLEEEIYARVIERRELAAFPTETPFYDMGTPVGLKSLERILR